MISRIQQCMLDKGDEQRAPNCNVCINEQLANHCDEYFRQYEAKCGSGGGDDKEKTEKFYFRTYANFAKFCQRLGTKDECKAMGCNWSERGGCSGKLTKDGKPKLKCKDPQPINVQQCA